MIDEAELARELEVIIEETKRKADTPGALALESLFELLDDEHRIRRWRMGREGPLRAMTREKLMTFYRNYYRPSNTVLAIVGDIDPVVATERAAALYGSIADARVERTPGPVERTAPGFRVRERQGDIAQTELVFGWRAPPLAHEDTPVLDVLATVLAGGRASRLCARRTRPPPGLERERVRLLAHGDRRLRRACERAPGADGTCCARDLGPARRVREGEITADGIERARRLLEAQWLRRLESPEGQANFLGSWELLGDWRRGADYHERLHETTAAMLTAVAKKWLDPATAGIIAYRPRGFPALGADAHAVHQLLDDGRPAPVDPAAPRTAAPALVGRGARHERTVGDVQLFRTADDVPILVRRRPGAALAHLGCFVAGGVIAEGAANSGITTLMARSALRGTSRRTASRLAEDAELLGGTPSAIVGTESFHWSLGVPRRSFGGAAELLADLVLDPAFPDEGVDAERAVTIASIAAMRDDMYRQPLRLAAMLAWPDHPYGRSTLGAEESVGTLTPDALREWHVARVRESAAVLCAVGDLDPQQAADVLAKRFAGLRLRSDPTLPPPAWPSKFVSTVEQRDKAQTALAMLFPGPRRGEKAQFDAELIGGIASGLGGRLFFEELRDRQSLAYTVLARAYPKARSGAFAAYIATSPAKEGVAREGLLRELARFTTDPVTTEELERARNYALGVWKNPAGVRRGGPRRGRGCVVARVARGYHAVSR